MIEFKSVTSRYPGGIRALDHVSFVLNEGSFTGLLGPSGAGKSTILWHIMGELQAGMGEVTCMGINPVLLDKKGKELYRRRIGYVAQELMLLQNRTVYDNVNVILRGMSVSKKDAEIRTHNVLDIVGLRDRLTAKPQELSGGEQQRLAIARALGMNPRILLADEPTGNLDPKRSLEIMTLFKDINAMGITVLIVTHEWELITSLGADVLYIENGVIRQGLPEQGGST